MVAGGNIAQGLGGFVMIGPCVLALLCLPILRCTEEGAVNGAQTKALRQM
jgi:hypothetical protein